MAAAADDAAPPPPSFYEWRNVFPFLGPLLAAAPALAAELRAAGPSAAWAAWPETSLYLKEAGAEWDVVPFCYTFPASDASATAWVGSSCAALPATAAALRRVPGVRTALLSRLGPRTDLVPHQGWAEISNHVLRCHLPLDLPAPGCSGVTAGGETRAHALGEIIVFDDSHVHSAHNAHATAARTVLIFDIARPAAAAPGIAVTGATRELTDFMEYFRA
jgi:hypothetical protein